MRVKAHARKEECDSFTPAEKESVESMLTGCYGIPWVVCTQEHRMDDEKCDDHTVTEPELVFTLTQSETIVHPLQNVARTRWCCVDLDFGSERVSGILDTGAQRSLLSN